MVIQYCSDLHLEFAENRKWISRNPLKPVGEILLLAGDIVTLAGFEDARDFFSYVSDHYAAVYWVPGNHEYYGYDIARKSGMLLEKIKDNVFLVNNRVIIQDELRLVFTTLWSRISPASEFEIQRCISDFFVIRDGGTAFTAGRFNALHEESLDFLRAALLPGAKLPTIDLSGPGLIAAGQPAGILSSADTPASNLLTGDIMAAGSVQADSASGGQTVVVTHHVPTFLNYPAPYRNSPLNEAFAVELFDLIADSGVNYWVYGHHHSNTPGFHIGKTNMLTNQLGYVRHHEHGSFRRDAVLG